MGRSSASIPPEPTPEPLAALAQIERGNQVGNEGRRRVTQRGEVDVTLRLAARAFDSVYGRLPFTAWSTLGDRSIGSGRARARAMLECARAGTLETASLEL